METSYIITLLFGSGVLVPCIKYIIDRLKANEARTEAVALGVQALLRDRLLRSYEFNLVRGYAPIHEKDNFENMWKQYHTLGLNGVMDEVHDKFMELPDREEDNE